MKRFICILRLTGTFFILLLLSQSSLAQYGMVQGWVRDKKGNPLAGASVTIKEKQIGMATDRKGHFILKVSPGEYSILVSFIDHSALQERITIRAGRIVEQNFTTAEIYKDCHEVVVLSSLSKQKLKNISNAYLEDTESNDTNAVSASGREQLRMQQGGIRIKDRQVIIRPLNGYDPGKNAFGPGSLPKPFPLLFFHITKMVNKPVENNAP